MMRLFNSWRAPLVALGLMGVLAGCTQAPAPATAQAAPPDIESQATTTLTGLTGTYYNNMDFTGTSVTQVDATVNKSWGTKAPVSGIAANTYSVRWTGQIQPQYSQTYTFYTTADDGVRLMVNGQALVDNWVDQGLTTKSGTIALQAGVKYDLRLEYYQNTNGAQVKLEWQSATQARQVVPQARLFPTGLDLNTILDLVQANAGFKALGITLDPMLATGAKVEDKSAVAVMALENQAPNFVLAGASAGKLDYLYRYVEQNGEGIFKDMLTGSVLPLGAITAYFNLDGTQSDSQYAALAEKFAKFFAGISPTSSSTSSIAVKALGVTEVIWCNDSVIPPPTTCGTWCATQANNYKKSICGIAAVPTDLMAARYSKAAMGSDKVNSFWKLIAKGINQSASPVTGPNIARDYYLAKWNYIDKWKTYLECLKMHSDKGCVPEMDPIPQNINLTVKVGTGGSISTSIGSKYTSNGALSVNMSYQNPTGGIDFLKFDGSLRPSQIESLYGTYNCPLTPRVLTATLVVAHNASNVANPFNVTINVNCVSALPKISDLTPTTISAIVGQTATGTLTFFNSGDPGSTLHYTVSSPTLTVDPTKATGTLDANQSASVSVSKLCEVAGTTTHTVTVGSTDAGVEAKTVQVTVECKASFDWPGYMPYPWEGTWRTQPVISYGRELCRYEALGSDGKNIGRYILWLDYDPNWYFPSARVPSFSGYETYNSLYNPDTKVGQSQYGVLNGFDFGTGELESAMGGAIARIIEAYKAGHPGAICN